MNKLFVLFLLFTLNLQAQTSRLVLLERFTSASSPSCATQNPAFNALVTANPTKVVAINYHLGIIGVDPFYSQNPVQNNSRAVYYTATEVPTTFMDGTGSNITQASINNEYAVAPTFKITLSYYISSDNDSMYIKAKFKPLTNYTSTVYKAYVIIVEKSITFPTPPGTNGETSFPMVMKKMLPSETGYTLPVIALTDSFILNYGWLITNTFNVNQLAVVSFVQHNTTKKIKQSAYAPLPINLITNINLVSNTSAQCGSNGAIDISVSGGVPPYNYIWSNGSTTQDLTNLTAGTYSVTVNSSIATYTVTNSPIPPVISSVSNISSCSTKMDWGVVSSATSYRVKYKTTDTSGWSSVINPGNVLTYTFNNLKSGRAYNFAVASFCSGGASAYTQTTFTAGNCQLIPYSAYVLNAQTGTSWSMSTVEWPNSCYATGYRIAWRLYGTTVWSTQDVTLPYYAILNLPFNTTYEYRIRTLCGSTLSVWTPIANFTTLPTPLRKEGGDEVIVYNIYGEVVSTDVNFRLPTGVYIVRDGTLVYKKIVIQ